MKKKFFIGIAMSLFAVATVFNMNIAEQNNAGDVSLDAIALMAQAQDESEPSGCADKEVSELTQEVTDDEGNVLYTRKVTVCESWGVGSVDCC